MREPYNITFNQYRNTVTLPYVEFVVGDYMTCPLSFKWMKNDLESFNQSGTKIYLVVQTPSGKSVDDRCTINDAEAGISNILLKQDFVTEIGLHRAELQAIDKESGIVRMTSPSFSYNVRKSLQDSNTEVAKNTLTQLQEALNAAANIEGLKDDLSAVIEQSNEMATKLIGSNESARVFNNANQSIATNVTTTLSFNSEIFDNADMHDVSVNNSRLTAKTEGVYLISASLTFANNATGTFRSATLMLNGVTPITNLRLPNIAGQDINLNMTTLFKLNANDYITVTVRQDANTPVDVIYGVHYSPQFSIIRVG